MSQQSGKKDRTIDEEAEEARRRLAMPADRPNDATTDEDARTPDTAPSEEETR